MQGPARIVCLTEESTELLYLLGEERRIVGISAYTVRPPEARRDKPAVSAFISGSVKKIQALEPDLVIGFSDIQADLAADLIRVGLDVLVLNQRSLEEIFAAMELIARIVGRSERGAQLAADWRARVEGVRARTAGARRPRVFFQEWDEPLITGIRWVSELIEIAGGEDCFGDLRDRSLAKDRVVSHERVREVDPELIIGCWCGKPFEPDWVRAQAAWSDVTAVRENRLVEMDPSIILQPGPALFLEGLDTLAGIIESVRESK